MSQFLMTILSSLTRIFLCSFIILLLTCAPVAEVPGKVVVGLMWAMTGGGGWVEQ